jgi:pyridoxal/pyridoxine/pyridoxamine kinase
MPNPQPALGPLLLESPERYKVLAIHSMPANGNAGLKMVMSVLGTRTIPVPSLLLSGIGSIPGFRKFGVPFETLLYETLALARQRGDKLLVYIGYLHLPEQAHQIARAIELNRNLIDWVLVDPVSGDHGRPYVPEDLIANWHILLEMADFAFPNITEAYLLGNARQVPFAEEHFETFVAGFTARFPRLNCVITSLTRKGKIYNRLIARNHIFEVSQPLLDARFGGSGDVFASYFILYAAFARMPFQTALKKAASKTEKAIRYSLKLNSIDLVLPL